MIVLEQLVQAKSSDPERCEDSVVVGDNFIAVIDGATDKTGRRYAGVYGGRFAARVLGRRIECLPHDIEATDAIDALTDALRAAVAEHDPSISVEADDAPTASCVIWSKTRGELWRVGDVALRLGTARASYKPKRIDVLAAGVRSAHMQALILAGESMRALIHDPGRKLILPLLEEQYRFRNLASRKARYAFGAVDGRAVPPRFLEVIDCAGVDQITIATDGYPRIAATLEATERYLQHDLARDPLRIGRHPSTKGVRTGHESFDDRAYIRFAT